MSELKTYYELQPADRDAEPMEAEVVDHTHDGKSLWDFRGTGTLEDLCSALEALVLAERPEVTVRERHAMSTGGTAKAVEE